jgi:hypothetical protein
MVRFGLIFCLFAVNAYADCPDTTKDSHAKHVYFGGILPPSDMGVKSAVSLVRDAYPNCDFKLNYQESRCRNIVEDDFLSGVCYLSTSIGYFFVTSDQVDGGWIIWNRWD